MAAVRKSGDPNGIDYLRLVNDGENGYVIADHIGLPVVKIPLEDEWFAIAIFDSVVEKWEVSQRRASLVEGRETKREHIIQKGLQLAKIKKDKAQLNVFEALSPKLPISEQTDVGSVRAFFAYHDVQLSIDPD